MKLLSLALLAYIFGSINFSILIFALLGKIDPRNSHSGNAGVTNVYRQAGIIWAIIVLILDFGRALLIAFFALKFLDRHLIPWISCTLIVGNRFPCFHGFRGGKGVANYLGFSAYVNPAAAVVSALAWVAVYGITRVPFIASFFMIFILAAGNILACGPQPASIVGSTLTAVIIYLAHMKNIREYRLRSRS